MRCRAFLDNFARQIDDAERAFECEKTAVLAAPGHGDLSARRAYLKDVERRLAAMHEARRQLAGPPSGR